MIVVLLLFSILSFLFWEKSDIFYIEERGGLFDCLFEV